MSLIFITSCVLNSIVSSGLSKRVMKFDGFDRSNFWEGRDVDISISSKKIKIMLLGNHSKHLVTPIDSMKSVKFFVVHVRGSRSSFSSSERCDMAP
jgi:hypothetical protein